MKRVIRVVLGAVLVCLVLAVVVNQSGWGQGINPMCPQLRTDAAGFPLNPPFSEYQTPSVGQITIEKTKIFDPNAPCCGTSITTISTSVDNSDPPITTTTITTTFRLSGNPAESINGQSFCQPPDADMFSPPSSTTTGGAGTNLTVTIIDNPFAGRKCPALVETLFATTEQGGAVKNCNVPCDPMKPIPSIHCGGSDFANGTGGNAG